MSSSREIPRNRVAPEPVRITNWPIRDEGPRAWAMAAGLTGVAMLSATASSSLLMGVAVFVALALSVWRLWLPVTFEFNSRGVTQTLWNRRRRIPWIEVARFERREHGVLLSADAERAPLAPLRSIYVRWHDQRDELLKVLEFFVDESQADAESAAAVATPDLKSTPKPLHGGSTASAENPPTL